MMEKVKEAVEAPKELSKAAAKKLQKKAEKAKKKEEYALRPKEPAGDKSKDTASDASKAPVSVFEKGFLKDVYEEKPVTPRTRFPPEPNGYLHIGHAKAIAVNFGFAKHHGGECILRYDDTNPEKEEEVYFTSIRDIVEWLGFKPCRITHSSDNFDQLYEHAEELIRRDKAYVCHCSKEEINMQRGGPDNRGERYGCKDRGRAAEENLAEFRNMRDGKYAAGEAFLRMKQKLTDKNEGNPQMWDLPAYRVTKNTEHAKTGNKWCIYPTYDFAHCLCDSYENITHSLCTTEFEMSRVSYNWLLEVLDIKKPSSDEVGPMQREYGRLNVDGTILSKRRIQMLVEGFTLKDPADASKIIKSVPPAVRGWDDPRLYTLVALRRRGIPAPALLSFVEELGVAKSLSSMQITRFEARIRNHLELNVPRLNLVLDPVLVVIEELEENYSEELNIPLHPKKPELGSRKTLMSRKVYIEREDFREEADPSFLRLAPGKTVGLLNVPFWVKATSVSKDENGRVLEVKAAKVQAETPIPKSLKFIHWVDAATAVSVMAREYNSLFLASDPTTLDWKSGGYADQLNSNSEVSYKGAVVEKALEEMMGTHSGAEEKASDDLVRFQAQRKGYFCVDSEKDDGKIVLNQIVSLREDKGK